MPRFRVRVTKTDVTELDVVALNQKDAHQYAKDRVNVSNSVYIHERSITLSEIVKRYKDDE
jgi:hypothetical protein